MELIEPHPFHNLSHIFFVGYLRIFVTNNRLFN
nr:MAG TPA: hypothetical protein [Caudoviricetes sp.]